jgi:hypothetical protein
LKEPLRGNQVMGKLVSVQGSEETHVYKLNIGPTLARDPQQPSNFWEYLRNWGGEWMWERIEDGQATKKQPLLAGPRDEIQHTPLGDRRFI